MGECARHPFAPETPHAQRRPRRRHHRGLVEGCRQRRGKPPTPQRRGVRVQLRLPGGAARTHEGRIHGSVVDAIGRWILGGTYAPDDLLPREDDLAAELGVSRTSIREAVKVLSAKGLLQARRRVGVRVRNRDEWNLLDPQVLSWHPDVGRDEALITSLIEARRIIEPAAAALAAKRATAADLAQIEQAYLGMERNVRRSGSVLRGRLNSTSASSPPATTSSSRAHRDDRGCAAGDLRHHQPAAGLRPVRAIGPPGGARVRPDARRGWRPRGDCRIARNRSARSRHQTDPCACPRTGSGDKSGGFRLPGWWPPLAPPPSPTEPFLWGALVAFVWEIRKQGYTLLLV